MAQRAIQQQFDNQQLAIIRQTVARGTTPEEFALFIEVCKYHALNPFARQIYAVVRIGRDGSRQLAIQTSIDGYRLLAERSQKYAGQIGPQWCGKDGVWHDVWLSDESPAAARVGVLRKDFEQPVWGVAKYKSYIGTGPLWSKMPDVLLAKCAESLALRKAFPAEMSGVYTREEMEQADRDEELPTAHVPDAHHIPADQPSVVESSLANEQQEATPKVTKPADHNAPAREKQIDYIKSLCKRLNRAEPENLAYLTIRSASDIIEPMVKELEEAKAKQAEEAALAKRLGGLYVQLKNAGELEDKGSKEDKQQAFLATCSRILNETITAKAQITPLMITAIEQFLAANNAVQLEVAS